MFARPRAGEGMDIGKFGYRGSARRRRRTMRRRTSQNRGNERAVHKLLYSIAKEELALAALVNTEAEKTRRVAAAIRGPFSAEEVVAFQQSVARVLEIVARKERLLLEKLRLVASLRTDGRWNDLNGWEIGE